MADTAKLLKIDYAAEKPKQIQRKIYLQGLGRLARFSFYRLITVIATLLVIAYLTTFGLIMAERGRERLPAAPLEAAREALANTFNYVVHHPQSYLWSKNLVPASDLVFSTLINSAGLLLISLSVATVLGFTLGILGVLSQRKSTPTYVMTLSVLGVSTPSFLLAMLLWIINIKLFNFLGYKPFPPTGFGWDLHLVMPVLVLAMRPLAQVAQVTYVSLSEVMGEDYIRTAYSKGLTSRLVRNHHALRNVMIPILTTLGTSMRFSLASLPVVEFFFIWPGVGLMLLKAIDLGMVPLITDLIVSLGLLFLVINLVLELLFSMIDPRLRENGGSEEREERQNLRQFLSEIGHSLRDAWLGALGVLSSDKRRREKLPPLPEVSFSITEEDAAAQVKGNPVLRVLRLFLGNRALVFGTLTVAGFVLLAVYGDRLTSASPYEIHGIMMVEGKIGAPPYRPSSVFPWGTDQIGRDLQALVLSGAKQTLTLAFLGMVARVLLGTVLGLIAGWGRGGFVDRLVNGAIGVWAAFPFTLFAMILILALGIQQGMWVFIVAICVVGWGEVAQLVRSQVIGIKPQLYIEAARVVGARTRRTLTRHVLPHLVPSLVVISILEMGGILMLLAELGFLNIFLGGGFRVEAKIDYVSYFSDVPEWGALLANIRDWWRSYPWMAWYPGIAFFLAIISFNLWGIGLRRFLEESRINLTRFFNRYTAIALVFLAAGVAWTVNSATPLSVYTPVTRNFDSQRAMEHIRVLSSPQYQGRETGTQGAKAAADYIAKQMEEIGLQPAGTIVNTRDTYLQELVNPRLHLTETPRLEILDNQQLPIKSLTYRQDFVEEAGPNLAYGDATAQVVGVTFGPVPDKPGQDPYGLGPAGYKDKILLVQEKDLPKIDPENAAGLLLVNPDLTSFKRKHLYGRDGGFRFRAHPAMYITPQVADQLLAGTGSDLAKLEGETEKLKPGEFYASSPGASVHMEIDIKENENYRESYYNVIGFIPGIGASMPSGGGRGLDSNAIIISAYYDGLGVGPDGTLYPGANDNASGVATMLEMARALKMGPYPPKKTIVFVAWAGGERYEGLSLENVMNAKAGFNNLNVETVIELSGVGSGSGNEIAFGEGSSYRLTKLFAAAAEKLGVGTTARGRGPHYQQYTAAGFGGRSAMSIYLSWNGSDDSAHLSGDTIDTIDPKKLDRVGRTALLAASVISREVEY